MIVRGGGGLVKLLSEMPIVNEDGAVAIPFNVSDKPATGDRLVDVDPWIINPGAAGTLTTVSTPIVEFMSQAALSVQTTAPFTSTAKVAED
jgi:hypothetical protein